MGRALVTSLLWGWVGLFVSSILRECRLATLDELLALLVAGFATVIGSALHVPGGREPTLLGIGQVL